MSRLGKLMLYERVPSRSLTLFSIPNYIRTIRIWPATPTLPGRIPYGNGIVPIFFLLLFGTSASAWSSETERDPEVDLIRAREETARKWAPLVWLHSQEQFYPADVLTFLPNVFPSTHKSNQDLEKIIPTSSQAAGTSTGYIPTGPSSLTYFLKAPLYEDCKNCPFPAFLYGNKPSSHYSPPTYAVIHSCLSSAFHDASFHRNQRHAQSKSLHYTNQPTERLEISSYEVPKTFGTQKRTVPFLLDPSAKDLTSANPVSVPTSLPSSKSVHPTSLSISDIFSSATEATKSDTTDSFSSDSSFSFSSLSSFGTDNFEDDKNESHSTHNISITYPSPSTIFGAHHLRVSSSQNKQGNLISSTVLKNFTTENNQYGSPLENESYIEAESLLPEMQSSTNPITYDGIHSPTSFDSNEEAQMLSEDNESLSHEDNEDNYSSKTAQMLLNDNESVSHKHNKNNDETNTNPKFSAKYDQNFFLLKHEGAPYMSQPNNDYEKSSYHTSHKGHKFTVTYWMFYPYNHGKDICTFNLGFLGRSLKPRVKGICHGNEVTMGSHVGDWEHVSILFEDEVPLKMYVSSHNFGAFYHYDNRTKVFHYASQDTRKGIPLSPNFPPEVRLYQSHPILFSGKGSHGLWATPGKHEYNRLPLLHDETDYGTPWNTWANLEVIDHKNHLTTNSPDRYWMKYEGRWGNPRHSCHPLMLGQCEFNDGPTGIIRKRKNFPCKKHG